MNQWSEWRPMPSPELCRTIEGPTGPGVYQVRNFVTGQNIQFGIGIRCRERMLSLFPKPYGSGTRNNLDKRHYILENWQQLEYRILPTATRADAKIIEDGIKGLKNHKFNT